MGMSKTSGGMGKIEDSRNEITTNAGNAYGVPAQCNVQAYILRIGLLWPWGFSSGLLLFFNSISPPPQRIFFHRSFNASTTKLPTARATEATTPSVERVPLLPRTPAKAKMEREIPADTNNKKRVESTTPISKSLQSESLLATSDAPPKRPYRFYQRGRRGGCLGSQKAWNTFHRRPTRLNTQ